MPLLISCDNRTPGMKEIAKVINHPIQLENFEEVMWGDEVMKYSEFRQKFKYYSIVYLEDGCSPCYAKYVEWHKRIYSIKVPDDYTILFIINALNYEYFLNDVKRIEAFKSPFCTIMDPHFDFIRENPDIPRRIIDRSLLIDSLNSIKMIGAPFETEELTKLFYDITNSKQGKP